MLIGVLHHRTIPFNHVEIHLEIVDHPIGLVLAYHTDGYVRDELFRRGELCSGGELCMNICYFYVQILLFLSWHTLASL